MANSLKGKVVLITGASSGFGEDAARLFAAEGARVVLAARRVERLQALAAEIKSNGGEAFFTPVDVTQRTDIDRMVNEVIQHYGQIDVLFNNAGFGRLNWFDQLDFQEDIQTQVNVNLLGLMQTTQAVLPHMIKKHSGHIINMSSVSGWIAAPLYSAYAATKFGVRGFTDALRREVGLYGIRVSAIYPGFAHTEFGEHTGSGEVLKTLELPAWTYMTSKYVAQCVVGLAKHPRRSLIIPWWFVPVVWFDAHLPGLVDWIVSVFVKNTR